jgi:hypothetical protein
MTLGVNMSVLDSDVQIVFHRIFEAAANIPAPVPANACVGETASGSAEHGCVDTGLGAATGDIKQPLAPGISGPTASPPYGVEDCVNSSYEFNAAPRMCRKKNTVPVTLLYKSISSEPEHFSPSCALNR